MFELKSAYIVNALINVNLRNTCFKFVGLFTFVEVTSRCACCPIVRTCKYLFYVVLFIQGSMSRDPPDSMQAIATPMVRVAFSPYFPLLKMSLTVIKYIAVSSSNCS